MAKKRKDKDLIRSGQKQRFEQYDWDAWFDGDVWELVPGVDFETKNPINFRSTVYTAAERRKIGVTTEVEGGHLLIQAYEMTEEEWEQKLREREERKKKREEKAED